MQCHFSVCWEGLGLSTKNKEFCLDLDSSPLLPLLIATLGISRKSWHHCKVHHDDDMDLQAFGFAALMLASAIAVRYRWSTFLRKVGNVRVIVMCATPISRIFCYFHFPTQKHSNPCSKLKVVARKCFLPAIHWLFLKFTQNTSFCPFCLFTHRFVNVGVTRLNYLAEHWHFDNCKCHQANFREFLKIH